MSNDEGKPNDTSPEQITGDNNEEPIEQASHDDRPGDRTEASTGEGLAGHLRLVGTDPQARGVTVDQIVEAILFSSDCPLAANRLASAVGGVTAGTVREIVGRLNERYEQMASAFQIEQIAGGYQMLTRPEYAGCIQRLHKVRSESRLSTAAVETLAVVAYKQPVVRAEIEAIRGVASGDMLRSLMEKGLIRIVGRAEVLGRPMLYGTTKRFLEVFGLKTIKDLPSVPELHMPERTEDAGATEENKTTPSEESTQPDESDNLQ